MGLTERLSNPQVTDLFHSLTIQTPRQDAVRAHRHPPRTAPDGRCPYRAVGDAVVAVMARDEVELRVRDVHQSVQRILGAEVPRSSVRSFLQRRSRGTAPLFEHTTRGRYRLIRVPGRAAEEGST